MRLFLKVSATLMIAVIAGLVYLDAWVQSRFDGKKWSLPAKVYARPLEVFEGRQLRLSDISWELERLGYQMQSRGKLEAGAYRIDGNQISVHSRGFRFWDSYESPQLAAIEFKGDEVLALKSSRNTDIFRLEPLQIGGIYPKHIEDRELVKLEDVPKDLIKALVVVEDRAFFEHFGVSPRGIMRALFTNVSSGELRQGGSTLTQQLVKNFYLTQERSLRRKAVEAVLALLLELHYDKGEILEAYLNEVYLGQSGKRAIHGFGLASYYYFRKPIAELSLAQQAMLVGIVKGPSYYSPRRKPERALSRRDLVLKTMFEQKLISHDQYEAAVAEPLGVVPKVKTLNRYQHYLDLVRIQLRQDYSEEDLQTEGLKIFTNMDPFVQFHAERSLRQSLAAFQKTWKDKADSLEAAVVVSNVANGDLLAIVGGSNSQIAGFNRALHAIRPVGSLMKPIVYQAALREAPQFTLASMLRDEPVTIKGRDNSSWKPRNYDKQSHGDVILYKAMANSYNQATARLGMSVGLEKVYKTLQDMGATREMDVVPSMLLGANSFTPLEVAALYQVFASGGFSMPLATIREVSNAEGLPLNRYPLSLEQKIPSAEVYLAQFALQQVFREGTARRANKVLGPALNLAGKTGTTNDQRDSWFAGFSGNYLAVSWVGRDDNQPTPLTGSSGALRIWQGFMSQLALQPLSLAPPEGIEFYWINTVDGKLSGPSCETARQLPFIKGSHPTEKSLCKNVPQELQFDE